MNGFAWLLFAIFPPWNYELYEFCKCKFIKFSYGKNLARSIITQIITIFFHQSGGQPWTISRKCYHGSTLGNGCGVYWLDHLCEVVSLPTWHSSRPSAPRDDLLQNELHTDHRLLSQHLWAPKDVIKTSIKPQKSKSWILPEEGWNLTGHKTPIDVQIPIMTLIV